MQFSANSVAANQIVQEARQTAMNDILNKVVKITASLGFVAVAASVYRVTYFGWHPNIICDLGTFAAIITLLLLRRRLPLEFIVPCIIITVGLSAALNYLTMGIVTIGPIMFAAGCIIASVYYGQRRGFLIVIGSLCALAGIAAADVSGILPRNPEIVRYVHSAEAWIVHLAGGGLFIILAVVTVGTVQDNLAQALTQLRASSSSLRQREEKYRVLSQTMRDVLFVQDLRLSFTFVSPSVQAVFGYTPEEFSKLGQDALMTPRSRGRAQKDYEEALTLAEQKDPHIPLLEHEYVRKDGTTFLGEVQLSFIRDAAGNVEGLQGVLRDVSDRKAAQEENALLLEQLRQSEKLRAIGQLAGGIAHDFNNQLSGISAYASLIQAQYKGDPRLTKYADGILAGTRRANDLTDKLLDYARKEPARSVAFDVNSLITEVASILEHSIGKNIIVETALEAPATTLCGDPTQIQSALLNLALNARDAMPGGGTLEFRTKNLKDSRPDRPVMSRGEQSPARILLTVTDTGLGIDEEHLPRIFDPFFTTKSAGHGTGMGLATVHSAVEAHGGTIWVDSDIGCGTCFSICLPTVPSEPAERAPSPCAEGVTPADGHILLVDDEAIVRRTARLMLEQLGYRVTTASNADEAIRSFQCDAFSVVLLDMVLPGRNGLEIYTALERIDPKVRVVFMSGYSAGLDAGELIEKKRIPFLAKPFSFDDLKKRLSQAVRAAC